MLVGERREGERSVPRATRKIFWLLAVGALVGWSYLFFQSELFEIREVFVEGAKMNDPVDVERGVYRILDQSRGWTPWDARHSWFVDSKELTQALMQSYYLEDVQIEKQGNHILRLKIKEYPHRLSIYKDQSFYWVDLRGRLDTELTKAERQQMLLRVYGKRLASLDEPPLVRVEKLEIGTTTQEIFQSERLKQFISLTVDLQRLQLPYREFRMESTTSSKIFVMNEQGTPVYFELEPVNALRRQLETYKAFWDQQRRVKGPKTYQYIDVRVPDTIYLR